MDSSDLELGEDGEAKPGNSWVATRYMVVEEDGIYKRRCRHIDCEKEYARGTSHMILKRHWAKAHDDPYTHAAKSRVIGSDGKVFFGNVSEDILKPLPPKRKIPPLKQTNLAQSLAKRQQQQQQQQQPQSRSVSLGGGGGSGIGGSPSKNKNKPVSAANQLQHELKQLSRRLRETLCIHLTFEIHTPKKGGKTFGILTAYSLDESSCKPCKSVVLDHRHLPYPDDFSSIYEILKSCITKFNCREKIISISTNGSDVMLKAVNEFEKRYRLTKNYNFTTIHIKCFSYFVHLNVNEVFRSQEDMLEDIRKIVNFINQNNFTMRPLKPTDPNQPNGIEGVEAMAITNEPLSTSGSDSKGVSGLKLPLDDRSRWDSTYQMIDTFSEQRGFIEPTLQFFQSTEDLTNVNIEWDKLYILVHLLKPFYQVITRCANEDYMPVSMIAALIPHLMDHLSNSQWAYDDLVMAAHKFKAQLDLYRQQFQNDLIVIAALLDPRIKDSFTSPEGKVEVMNMLRKRVQEFPSPLPVGAKAFAEAKQTDSIFRSVFVEPKSDEVLAYLEQERECGHSDVCNYWECRKFTYPTLYNLARSLICVQASSVPSERMFSAAESAERERRAQLDSAVPKELIRSWSKYLEK